MKQITMKLKANNSMLMNWIIFSFGVVLILIGVIILASQTISNILISVGSSITASSIISILTFRYLFHQKEISEILNEWGIENIYFARAEINTETNELLKRTSELEICAMGLKGFRDAQSDEIKKRVISGMKIKILTITPESRFLPIIDKKESIVNGSTQATINDLFEWIKGLHEYQKYSDQIEVRTYDSYPFDFYFCMDGVVFTGPYQTKSSQQTITYKFSANSKGANYYRTYFNSLWEEAVRVSL